MLLVKNRDELYILTAFIGVPTQLGIMGYGYVSVDVLINQSAHPIKFQF